MGHVLKVERSERRSAFISGTIYSWSSCGKDTGVGTSFWCSSDTGERSPMKIRDFGIIWDIDPEDQENDPNSKIQNVTSQRIFTKTKKIFLLLVSNNSPRHKKFWENASRFPSFRNNWDISAMGGKDGGDRWHHPFIFELSGTQTFQNFWTEGNRVILRRDPASWRA